ncbi:MULTISPECIES: Gfo/Idh/MocA family protein [unclassified Arthrobacter]|uniref:Gfo/Idh/MocA family protein n=1 Tax=unclassified Arthrobacter TaxID=235627 RepID=UPI001F3861F1|nr:Gfo/Idh/MocA family oxidoreductase [Arthrobacter sp. FW305-BF8]UKA54444.1 Gfo/Idh/MocA family oxidoreductase [Arthrobacter sp. FW305-BF8]
MTKTPLRIGLIGAGRMGRSHAQFIAANPDTELTAVADPINSELSSAYGAEQFDNYEALIAGAKVDAVIIATPNDTHVETASFAIEAGIPCLLEKPVGVNLTEVARLAGTVESTGVPVLVGHHRRHHPLIAAAKKAIQSGAIGDIVAVNGLWLTTKPESYFDSWRRGPGAGVMLINLVHDLDIMRYLIGEISSVQAVMSNRIRGFEVEDTAGLLFQFERGTIGTLTGSDTAAAPWGWDQNSGDDPQFAQQPDEPSLLIAGTKGSLSVPQLKLWSYPSQRDWHTPLTTEFLERPGGGALQNQLAHFCAVVREEAEPIVSVADAGRSLAAVEAAHEAARTQRAVAPGLAGLVIPKVSVA